IVTVDVRREEENLRLAVQKIEPLDTVVAHAAAGLRIFVGEAEALPRLKSVIAREAGGRGRVTVVLDLPSTDIAVALPGGLRDARRDLLLPMVAFIHRLVEGLALPLAFEAAHPDINRIVGLAAETAGDHHALSDLEGDDLLFHDLEPFGHLAGANLVLAQFVE